MDHHRRRACRKSTDLDGFTLIEVVVALTILAVGVVGVIGVTNGSFRVAGAASSRSKMVATVTKEIEALRAMKYEDIQRLPSPSYDSRQDSVGGVSYNIERTLTKLTGEDHWQAVIAVSWVDQSGPHEVAQTTFLYPGGVGPKNQAAPVEPPPSNCQPPTPTSLVASQVTDSTQMTSTIDLVWTAGVSTCPVASYVIKYVTGLSSIVNEVTRLATATTYRVTGLTAGTEYKFQVAARSASGELSSYSNIASMSTAAYSASTCRVGTITLTPPTANKKGFGQGSGLKAGVTIRVPTEGTCPGFVAVYKPTASTTQTTTLTMGADRAYTGVVNKDVTWDVGRRYVDIFRTSDNVKVGSVLLTVCEHNVSNCA